MSARILVIDDEPAIRDSLKMILEYEGYEFLGAPSGQDGIALVERGSPDMVFLDVKMPGMDGIETLTRLRSIAEMLPVVMISGHATRETAFQAAKLGRSASSRSRSGARTCCCRFGTPSSRDACAPRTASCARRPS